MILWWESGRRSPILVPAFDILVVRTASQIANSSYANFCLRFDLYFLGISLVSLELAEGLLPDRLNGPDLRPCQIAYACPGDEFLFLVSPVDDWGSYQRVSPDILPLGNGRKPILRTWKEDDADHGSRSASHSPLEAKPIRPRSVSGSAGPSPTRDHQFPRTSFPSDSPTSAAHSESQPPAPSASAKSFSRHHETINGVGGDVILQWGHNKRSRGPRAECRASGDETSSHSKQMLKVPRRSAAAMPPPPCAGSYARGAHLRSSRSGGTARSDKRPPSSPPSKAPPRSSADGSMNPPEPKRQSADQEAASPGGAAAIGEKLNLDQFEWPRIFISLSRKEKEDDFLAMKGTKLPQRPKKRAKNIDKTLQGIEGDGEHGERLRVNAVEACMDAGISRGRVDLFLPPHAPSWRWRWRLREFVCFLTLVLGERL
ncbi:hypothetical protein BHE74_00031102 [Ensete ventricosum]|nr:hypothetical protein BHE74_00031102 [Ensete ventricosum]